MSLVTSAVLRAAKLCGGQVPRWQNNDDCGRDSMDEGPWL